MGSKSKILYFTIMFVNVACFVLDLFRFTDFTFFMLSFGISLILIGLLLMIRGFSLKIDSSIFIGILIFICGILQLIAKFRIFEFSQIWPGYIFSAALASIVVSIYFKDKFQLKLFFLFLGLGIIGLLYVMKLYVIWWMIGLMLGWFVLYFIINLIMFRKGRK